MLGTVGSAREAHRACFICGETKTASRGSVASHALLMCPRCGLQFLDPPPDAKTIARIHADYSRIWNIAELRAEVSEMKRRTFRGYLSRLSPFIREGRLLDIGCANGELMEVFEESGYEVYGVETSPHGAKSCVGRFGPQRILAQSLGEGDFPHGYFDVITLSDVFEHISEPLSFADLVDDILGPGGILMITTPDTSSLSNRLLGMRWPHYKEEHLYYYNRLNIVRLFSERFEPLFLSPAKKTLTPRYCLDILKAYSKSRLIRHAAGFLDRLPKWLSCLSFTIMIGEMFVLLKKKNRTRT